MKNNYRYYICTCIYLYIFCIIQMCFCDDSDWGYGQARWDDNQRKTYIEPDQQSRQGWREKEKEMSGEVKDAPSFLPMGYAPTIYTGDLPDLPITSTMFWREAQCHKLDQKCRLWKKQFLSPFCRTLFLCVLLLIKVWIEMWMDVFITSLP